MRDRGALAKVAAEAAHCKRCDLWRHATQTVCGEGGAHAAILMVGEEPGDHEHVQGHPVIADPGATIA